MRILRTRASEATRAGAAPGSHIATKGSLSDNPAIFRLGKSGLNEELVYKPQDDSVFFFPLLLFPGGNDLLAVAARDDSIGRIFRVSLSSHEAVDLGEVPTVTYLPLFGDAAWAEPGNSIFLSPTVNGL